MAMIEWTPRLSVAVSQFDDEHKKLITMINDLHQAMQQGKSKAALASILDRLIDYTASHFAHEEQAMRAHQYPDIDKHIQEHKALVAKAMEIQKQAHDHATAALSMQTMSFLSNWLTSHIQGTDQRYGPFLNSKGVR
jgi:hemerythrin